MNKVILLIGVISAMLVFLPNIQAKEGEGKYGKSI